MSFLSVAIRQKHFLQSFELILLLLKNSNIFAKNVDNILLKCYYIHNIKKYIKYFKSINIMSKTITSITLILLGSALANAQTSLDNNLVFGSVDGSNSTSIEASIKDVTLTE